MRSASPFKLALALAACTLLGGCNVFKGPWYDPFLLLSSKKEYTGNNRMVSVDVTGQRPTPGMRLTGPRNLRVSLIKLSLPVGTFSGNEKAWRQLDQDALDSDTSILLAENGIRAGVAPQDRWPALHKLIDVPGVVNQQYTLETDGRSSVDIVTHPNITEQTVSSIDRDREMHVRSFDRCDNSIRLSLGRRRDMPRMTTIQLEPVVQLGTIAVVRSPQETGIVRNDFRREETFANLRMAAPLAADQFLVLAPANPKENNFSVGARFLTDNDQMPPMETVLVFLPITDSDASPPVRRTDHRTPAVSSNR